MGNKIFIFSLYKKVTVALKFLRRLSILSEVLTSQMVIMDLVTPKILCQIDLGPFILTLIVLKYREAKVRA